MLLFPLNSNLKQIEDITDNVHELINLHRPTQYLDPRVEKNILKLNNDNIDARR